LSVCRRHAPWFGPCLRCEAKRRTVLAKEKFHAQDANRTARIEARIAPDALAIVKRAAEIEGRSVSDFVVAAAHAAAQKAIEEALSVVCERPVECKLFFFGFAHVVRLVRVSGILMRPFTCRGPVWKYADRVQHAGLPSNQTARQLAEEV
jgi:hypothetical protein